MSEATLADLRTALWQRMVRADGEKWARLEFADFRDAERRVETMDEKAAIARRWLKTFAAAPGAAASSARQETC